MCEHGDTVDAEVYICAEDSYTGEGRHAMKPIDSCIASLVCSLNLEEWRTRASWEEPCAVEADFYGRKRSACVGWGSR